MVAQYRAVWSVPGGGTGYSVFHAINVSTPTEGNAWATAVKALLNVPALLPNDVTISFESEITLYNEVTGTLTGTLGVTPPSNVAGTAAGGWAGAAGGRYTWETGVILNGKRLRGRTYIVPLAATAYDTDGTLTSSAVTSFNAAASAYVGSSVSTGVVPCVWSRVNGSDHAISSGSMRDKTAILRSRRD